jgi:dihydroorotase
LTVLAPDAPVTVRASAFKSKARNTPFDGWTLRGGVAATIVGGRAVFVSEDLLGRTGLAPAAK